MSPELKFAKRAITFAKLLLKSNNKIVNMITGMGLYGRYSIVWVNIRHLKAKLLLISNNKVVNMITGMGLYGRHSILGANIRHLKAKYDMNIKVINDSWKRLCQDQNNIIRTCEQIKELCYMRDTHNTGILSVSEVTAIIDCLCTE